jgi:16S rRNA G527 N7-methylase RsmG
MNDSAERIVSTPSELLKKHDPENKLERYYRILLEENKRVNLVSRETIQNMAGADEDICRPRRKVRADEYQRATDQPHHVVSRETGVGGFATLMKLTSQSLIPLEKIKLDTIENYLDIGSGGGFPAIPILLTQKVQQATLVERTKKKASALRRILLALDLKADIISQSFEELTFQLVFDLITMRQVKLTSRLFEKIRATMQSNSVFFYYNATDMVPPDPHIQKLTYEYTTSSDDPDGKFTIFRKRG